MPVLRTIDDLENKVKLWLKENNISHKIKILVAVSGGVDSVVLTNVLHNLNLNIAIVHCNFQLRGIAADKDEIFVKNLAKKLHIPYHCKSFETIDYAAKNHLSIQMAARKLRYNFFEEIAETYHYAYIATAHHLNDSIETCFINMLRGTGIAGLTGISDNSSKYLRPLINISKEEILGYAKKNRFRYRHDASNDDADKYIRNFIRLKILPQLMKIQPAFENIMQKNFLRWNETASLYQDYVSMFQQKAVKMIDDQSCEIDANALRNEKYPIILLSETLSKFNFNFSQCIEIAENLTASNGTIFQSSTHQLLIDRKIFKVFPKTLDFIEEELIITNFTEQFSFSEYVFAMELLLNDKAFAYSQSKEFCFLDYEKIKFPLTVRYWKHGDSFVPLGMKGRKKLSDFFKDIKIDRFSKNKIPLLLSNNEICWVVGCRISNNFKITDKTKKILKISIK